MSLGQQSWTDPLRIATWNVNSVRQRLEHLLDWMKETQPDVVCLQEIKCVDEAFPRAEIEKRLKALSAIKIHPREQQENAALIARMRAAYENLLGDKRQSVGRLIAEFEGVLSRQDAREINEARRNIEQIIGNFERDDVF